MYMAKYKATDLGSVLQWQFTDRFLGHLNCIRYTASKDTGRRCVGKHLAGSCHGVFEDTITAFSRKDVGNRQTNPVTMIEKLW